MNLAARILASLALGAMPLAAAAQSGAAAYPSKSVRIVIPFPPGGTADLLARLFADHLANTYKITTIPESRPGGGTVPSTAAVAAAEPDGYTLLLGSPSLATYKVFFKNPSVDTERDLAPISLMMVSPYVLAVSASVPAKTLGEVIAYAKANPGKLRYGGYGSQYLATEFFKQIAGVDLYHIGYKGDAPAITALMTDEIQFLLSVPLTLKPHVDSGKVRALSSSMTTMRSPGMPSVPNTTEAGLPGFDVSIAFGLVAPARTPMDIRAKLANDVAQFVKKPDVVSKFQQAGFQPVSSTPDEYSKMLSTDIRRWVEIAKRLPPIDAQ